MRNRRPLRLHVLLTVGVAVFCFAGCGGPSPGSPCETNEECSEPFACGPLKTCEEPRLIDGCRMTEKCQEFGYCLAHEGHCRASEASCRASLRCQMAGYCSLQKGRIGCMVASDDDCKESDACKVGGKCVQHNGRCVRGEPAAEEPAAEEPAPAEEGAAKEP